MIVISIWQEAFTSVGGKSMSPKCLDLPSREDPLPLRITVIHALLGQALPEAGLLIIPEVRYHFGRSTGFKRR